MGEGRCPGQVRHWPPWDSALHFCAVRVLAGDSGASEGFPGESCAKGRLTEKRGELWKLLTEAKIGETRSLSGPGGVKGALEPAESCFSVGAATRSHTAGESRREPSYPPSQATCSGEPGNTRTSRLITAPVMPPTGRTHLKARGQSMKPPPGDTGQPRPGTEAKRKALEGQLPSPADC